MNCQLILDQMLSQLTRPFVRDPVITIAAADCSCEDFIKIILNQNYLIEIIDFKILRLVQLYVFEIFSSYFVL